ncbi:MAG: homoaconitate hydratase [Pseudobutyrivibrio sp.]|nr:homoaconitate hydratase [Pseudobutyrivibrio sp.]
MIKNKCKFLDTTLRDGEQTPGVSYKEEERFQIAKKLDEMGLDMIEIGFAASGKAQVSAMKKINKYGLRAKTISLARPIESDIKMAKDAGVDGIIIVAGFSDIHLKYKFNKTCDQMVQQVLRSIDSAKEKGLYVQVSAEDGTRTDTDRLHNLAERFFNEGADRVCISDTVGIATPKLMEEKIKAIKINDKVAVSAHCHNDFGLATINSIAAVLAGAESIAVTMNGLGERCGNASLEQCVMALTRLYDYETNIKIERIVETAELIEKITRLPISPMSPVIGKNCFRHESGIHVEAILKEPSCYEAYAPEIILRERELVLGKTNGRKAINHFGKILNENLTDVECEWILKKVKENADTKKQISVEFLKGMIKECRAAIQ